MHRESDTKLRPSVSTICSHLAHGLALLPCALRLTHACALQISGPTGPMTVVMGAVIAKYRAQPAVAFTVVSLAGLLQVCTNMAPAVIASSTLPLPWTTTCPVTSYHA